MPRLYWTALHSGNRVTGFAELTRILDRHAVILHSQRFSDVALGLSLEVAEDRIALLHSELSAVMRVQGDAPPPSRSERDWTVMLNVTFVDSTGNLEVEVPMVPG